MDGRSPRRPCDVNVAERKKSGKSTRSGAPGGLRLRWRRAIYLPAIDPEKVNDGGTQALMTAFYTALQSGTTKKAEALQKAQIALITGDDSVLGRSANLSILAITCGSLR